MPEPEPNLEAQGYQLRGLVKQPILIHIGNDQVVAQFGGQGPLAVRRYYRTSSQPELSNSGCLEVRYYRQIARG